jgi:hypothetical protein
VEGNVRVSGEPLVILLVCIEVVQDDVDLAVGGFVGDDLLHEGLEVGALLGLRGLPADDAGGHFKGGEQVNGAMALVCALESLDHLPATGLDIAASALQSLDRGLLVDTQDHGLFRWVQVQSDDIRCFGREFGVRADTPGAMALQLDALPTQHAPHNVVRHVQRLRQRTTIPTRHALRRGQFQLRQDAVTQFLPVLRRLARPSSITQPGQAMLGKAPTPQSHGVRSYPDFASDLLVLQTPQTAQDDPRSLRQTNLAAATP